MAENIAFFLECESKDKHTGMTTLSGRLQDLIRDFAQWVERNDLTLEDIAYAKIYRCSDFGCVGELVLDGGQLVLEPHKVRGGAAGTLIRRALFHLKYWWRSVWWAIRFRNVTVTEVHDGDPNVDEDTDEK